MRKMVPAHYWLLVPFTGEEESVFVNKAFGRLRSQSPPQQPARNVNGAHKSRVVREAVAEDDGHRDTKQYILGLMHAAGRPMSSKEITHALVRRNSAAKVTLADCESLLRALTESGLLCKTRRGRRNKLWALSEPSF